MPTSASLLTGASRIRKGSLVFVHGRMELRQWTDQQGQQQSRLECIAESVEVISLPERGSGQGGQGDQGEPGEEQASRPSRAALPRLPEAEDDMPF